MADNNEQKVCNLCIPFSILSLPPEQFTLVATLLGFLLTQNLSVDLQNSLGNFFQTVGQIIVTIAGQKDIYESLVKSNGQSKKNSSDNSLKK